MKNDQKKPANPASSRGSVLILTALLMTFFIGMAALAIDIGYVSTTKNELQNTADAAALAGAGYLGITYNSLAVSQQGTYIFDKADKKMIWQSVGSKTVDDNPNTREKNSGKVAAAIMKPFPIKPIKE